MDAGILEREAGYAQAPLLCRVIVWFPDHSLQTVASGFLLHHRVKPTFLTGQFSLATQMLRSRGERLVHLRRGEPQASTCLRGGAREDVPQANRGGDDGAEPTDSPC